MEQTRIEPTPILIRQGDRRVLRLLKKRTDAEQPLRWTSFHLRQPVEEGLLLFHTMTLEFVLLPTPLPDRLEAPDGALRDYLRDHWFLIPEDLDEHRTAREIRETLYLTRHLPEGIEKFTILTTTACNARCFYCFEKDWEPITMGPETADRTADYILAHAAPSFHIDWFGGEPLVNRKAIDRISKRLVRAGANFDSSMFTNGYLFDEEMIRQAVDCWKLEGVVITLDGCRELYNRTKAYVNPTEDPFTRVIRNIHLLDAAGVRADIRMNLDAFNREEIFRLTDYLIGEFAGVKNKEIYPIAVYEEVEDPSTWRSEEDRTENYRAISELRDRLVAAGLLCRELLPRAAKTHRCMADSGNMVMILPDGKLGLCEHYLRDNYIGDLQSEEYDRETMEAFRELHPEIPSCADCPVYPQCIRLKKCVQAICHPQMRAFQERYYRKAVVNAWKAYQRRKEREQQ